MTFELPLTVAVIGDPARFKPSLFAGLARTQAIWAPVLPPAEQPLTAAQFPLAP
jgi:hypothetical protein